MKTNELYFSIHGVNIKFTTSSPVIASPVANHLSHFQQRSLNGAITLAMNFDAVPKRGDIPAIISSSARKLFSRKGKTAGDILRTEWQCDIYWEHNQLIADFHEQGLVVINDVSGEAVGYLIKPEAMHPDLIASYFHIALVELLKRKGLYTLHATALVRNGRGVLIPGYSGRGKTTAFLSLLRSGYRYLSDDHPFFRVDGKKFEVLSFPLKVDVTEPTIDFFPELREAPAALLHQGVQKRFFFVEDIYPGGIGESCEPAIIIFPQVIDYPTSHLEPLPKSRALEEILPHGMLVYDREVAKREFQALSRLVQKVDCYRLYFGQDVLDLPQLITPLLDKGQKLNGTPHSQVLEKVS